MSWSYHDKALTLRPVKQDLFHGTSVAVEVEDDGLVPGEEAIKGLVRQGVRMMIFSRQNH